MESDSKLLELYDFDALDDTAPGFKDHAKLVAQLKQLFPGNRYNKLNRRIDHDARLANSDVEAILKPSDTVGSYSYNADVSISYQTLEKDGKAYESRIVKLYNRTNGYEQEVYYAISLNPEGSLDNEPLNLTNFPIIITSKGVFKLKTNGFPDSHENVTLEEITDETMQEALYKELTNAIDRLPLAARNPNIDTTLYERGVKEIIGQGILQLLEGAEIRSIGDLVACSEKELRSIPYLGTVTLSKIKKVLKTLELSLREE